MATRNSRKAVTIRKHHRVAFVILACFTTTMLVGVNARSQGTDRNAGTVAIIVKRPECSGTCEPKVREIVNRVVGNGYEKLFQIVTKITARKLNFYRHGETPSEPAERQYLLEFRVVYQPHSTKSDGNDCSGDDGDWSDGILFVWSLTSVRPPPGIVVVKGQTVLHKRGEVCSQRYPTIEEELRKLLSSWDPRVFPDGYTLLKKIEEEPPITPPDPPPQPPLTQGRPLDFLFGFEFDSHVLKPTETNKSLVAELEKAVKLYFFNNKTGAIRIVGHASREDPNEPDGTRKRKRRSMYNMSLSLRRAWTIEKTLLESGVVGRIETDGRGDTTPKVENGTAVPNDNEVNRKKNRRVVVTAN